MYPMMFADEESSKGEAGFEGGGKKERKNEDCVKLMNGNFGERPVRYGVRLVVIYKGHSVLDDNVSLESLVSPNQVRAGICIDMAE